MAGASRRLPGFRSFRARLLTFVLGLLLAVQGAAFLAVNRANVANARQHVEETLEITARAFRRALDARARILTEKVRVLSADFAFKEVAVTGDPATVLSALENHRDRVDADVMMLVALEGRVVADTLHPEGPAGAFPLPGLLEAAFASDRGEASAIGFLEGRAYQLVVVPLFTPEPTAWIAIGFAVDDALAAALRDETGTQVTLLRDAGADDAPGRSWEPLASSLPVDRARALPARLARADWEADRSLTLALDGEEFVSLVAPVETAGEARVAAVLQRSWAEALAPHLRLRRLLAAVFGGGVLLSLLGGVLLAGRVTRPVRGLAGAARRVQEGDYPEPVTVRQRDELGRLAEVFNHMVRGLAERDRVRSLLGKVVSPEIAEELLGRGIELGGEERVVSVLFCDVRDFTALSEKEPPVRVVDLLNTWLTRASDLVERHGGVVDKYIGDAVMALYGAPVHHDDDACRALRTALALRDAVHEVNALLAARAGRRLAVGVGVHTDRVVAGNMGSRNRLNYTVIGDGVNLASRLEGLTKRYGVPVVASAATAEACPELAFRELDRVRVKGRRTPVAIFEPLAPWEALDPGAREALERQAAALARFRARDFAAARDAFAALAAEDPGDPLYALWTQRAESCLAAPPGPDWDGTVDWPEK